MSEKRFVYEEEPYHFPIKKRIRDTQNNETYIYDLRECCELLNEQQSTIERLERKLELKTEEAEYLNQMMEKWGMVKDE